MSLNTQIMSLVMSFVYGIGTGMGYSFINRWTYFFNQFIKFFIEIALGSLVAYGYMWVLVHVNGGYLNGFMLLAFVLGVLFFMCELSLYCLYIYEKIFRLLHVIFLPFYFVYDKLCGIVKKIGRRVNNGKKRSKSGLV